MIGGFPENALRQRLAFDRLAEIALRMALEQAAGVAHREWRLAGDLRRHGSCTRGEVGGGYHFADQSQAERVGGIRYTVKDGIVYDAKKLLADVAAMVEQQKKERATTATSRR